MKRYPLGLDDLDLDVLKDKGYTYDSYFPEADKIAAYAEDQDIICQCEYGQSRSAGCAAAILEHFYHTGITVFADYPLSLRDSYPPHGR